MRNLLSFNSNVSIVIYSNTNCHERLCTYGDPRSKVRRESHPERAGDRVKVDFNASFGHLDFALGE